MVDGQNAWMKMCGGGVEEAGERFGMEEERWRDGVGRRE